MPIRQTITTAFLTLALLLALAACGENPTNTDTVSLPPTASPEATGASPSPVELYRPVNAEGTELFQGFGDEYPTDPQAINYKDFSPQPFCYDENGVVYFADLSDKLYIYSYQNERSELLVELPAYSLNYHNRCIYFLTNNKPFDYHNQTSDKGLLYKYNIDTAELMPLSDYEMFNLRVTDDGIFYTSVDDNNYLCIFRFNESDGTATFLYNFSIYMQYGEYNMKATMEPYAVCFDNGQGTVYLYRHGKETMAAQTIAGHYLYYWPSATSDFVRVDLVTGETLTINTGENRIANRYTVYEDTLFVVLNDSILYRYDEEMSELIPLSDNSMAPFSLYSGPNGLYGAFRHHLSMTNSVLRLVKLVLNEDDGNYYAVPLKGE